MAGASLWVSENSYDKTSAAYANDLGTLAGQL